MCGRHGILPTSIQVVVSCDRTGLPFRRGGFAEVWKGKHGDLDVAVKVITMYQNSDVRGKIGASFLVSSLRINVLTVPQDFCKEALVWKSLRHPNVLPLIGVSVSERQFAMISELMENGNVNDYVKANPNVDRVRIVGFAI
jgi:serine/threonine protein kinase